MLTQIETPKYDQVELDLLRAIRAAMDIGDDARCYELQSHLNEYRKFYKINGNH